MKIRRLLLTLLLAAGIVCVAGCDRVGSPRYRHRDTSRSTTTHTVRKPAPAKKIGKPKPASKIKKRSTPKKPSSKIKRR